MHLFSLETKSKFPQLPHIPPKDFRDAFFVSPGVLLVTPVCKQLFNFSSNIGRNKLHRTDSAAQ